MQSIIVCNLGIGYLWKAGGCLYKEDSAELEQWVEEQKQRVYESRVAEVVDEINKRLALLPKKGPGMKSRRERLEKNKKLSG
jgi:hypothetical protein